MFVNQCLVFIVRSNTTCRTLHIQLSFAVCFDYFLPSSGRFYNIHGKEYQGGGLFELVVNIDID